MPKVLRIINRFNLGGPTYNVTYLTKHLNNGYETMLIGGVPDVDEADSQHIMESMDVVPTVLDDLKRTPNLRDDLKAYYQIKEIIRQYQPDIVHTHASKAGALGRYAAMKSNVPVIVHTYHGHVFDGYFGWLKTKVYKGIERWLASKSTAIVAISKEQKHDLSEVHNICSAEKIRIVPLGFDLDRFHVVRSTKRELVRKRWHLEEDTIAVAIIGRLAPIKNHTLFLDSLKHVRAYTHKEVHVFIVGDGSEREYLEEKVTELGQRPNFTIQFTSWVKDIAEFNSAMDIICLTSNNEGTPVSLIEAQASGVPVVSTDVGGVRDILLDGVTGFIVPPNNPQAFAEKLLVLIEDDKKRVEMSQNGWTYVKDKFHYMRLVKDMEGLYNDLLNKTQ